MSYAQNVRDSNPLPPTIINDINFHLLVQKFFSVNFQKPLDKFSWAAIITAKYFVIQSILSKGLEGGSPC
jgi:hypothetical protein